MAIDTYFEKTGVGLELESKGLLKRIKMGELNVITPTSPERFIGTTVLTDCASLGLVDIQAQIAGVLHTRFTGAEPDTWYEQFGEEANTLIELAHENGAAELNIAFVNVRTGYRTYQLNKILGDYAQRWIQKRIKTIGDIRSYTWINAEAYFIDKTTGIYSPY